MKRIISNVKKKLLNVSMVDTEINTHMKGKTFQLMKFLCIVQLLTLFVDFLMSIFVFSNPGYVVLIHLVFNLAIALFLNQVYYYFYLQVKGEVYSSETLADTFKLFYKQVILFVLIYMIENIATQVLGNIFIEIPYVNSIITILIRFWAMLISALSILFVFEDGYGVIKSMKTAWKLLSLNRRLLFELSIAYVVCSFTFNQIIVIYLQGFQQTEINNVIHSLLGQHAFNELGIYFLLTAASFIILSYFQTRAFLGVGILFDANDNKKRMRRRKQIKERKVSKTKLKKA